MSALSAPAYERQARLSPPPGATDCHAHIFGPFDRFPLAPERHYDPPAVQAQHYLGMLDTIGIARGVLVQPSAHGTDCGALLHALDSDRSRLRGVAVVQQDVTHDALRDMHVRGVRGARFSQLPGELNKGFVDFAVLEKVASKLGDIGWHGQLLAFCDSLLAWMPRLTALGIPLVIDHMGLFDAQRGSTDPQFRSLVRLLGSGRIWLKLTPYKLSKRYPDYADVEPFHRELLAANPERLLWGSDWPHVEMAQHEPETGRLLQLFDRWTGDEALRRRILVDNPATLYGF